MEPLFSNPPSVISSIFNFLSIPELETIIWEMYRLSDKVLSFDTFEKIFNILEIENGLFELDFPMILETQPFPFVAYMKTLGSFVMVTSMNDNTISIMDSKKGITEYAHLAFTNSWTNQLLYFDPTSEVRIPMANLIPIQEKINLMNEDFLTFFLKIDNSVIPIGKIQSHALLKRKVIFFETVIGTFKNLLTLSVFNGEAELISVEIKISSNQRYNALQFYLEKPENSVCFQYLGIKGAIDKIFKLHHEKYADKK
jgi:ABC-type bacteriocin/lantibiotic exporters, contain an N-terminal double-glycine peptidase domain